MTTAQHTPGSWAAAPTGEIMRDYSQPYCVAELGTPNLIAGCFGDIEGGEEVAEANARLIASAPDMLAALKQARLYVECCTEPDESDLASKALAALDAAVAKAEGRS